MLAALTGKRRWLWAVFGKHPVVRDFFRVGVRDNLTAAFCGWLENGYRAIAEKGACPPFYSWRFWAKGVKKGEILIGLLKGSSDSIGRCYPLMVTGVGALKGWENVWSLLPFSLEKVWGRMEYAASRGYPDLETLKVEIGHLPVPSSDWRSIEGEKTRLKERTNWDRVAASVLGANETLADKAARLAGQPHALFSLDHGIFSDHFTRMAFWCHLIQARSPQPPNALFIGGNPENAYFSVFRKPLAKEDFVGLCGAPSGGGEGRF